MEEIVFATNNKHKIEEIKSHLGQQFKLVGLAEKGIIEDIPEDYFTLEENAIQKARYIYDHYGINCFADDTGLEINALNGEPGVFSARYSRIGEPVYPDMEVAQGNIRKVLEKMLGKRDRQARFRTVIALIKNGKQFTFEGIVNGVISKEQKGNEGFGYDPIFLPEGYSETFAEMNLAEKNQISHRARAVNKLVEFLKHSDQNQVKK